MADTMNMEISEEARLAVKRGAYWLDENYPGWENRLELDTLFMNDCHLCVIGQVVGNYFETIAGEEWAIEHGFDADEYYGYSVLEKCWTDVVIDRLERI